MIILKIIAILILTFFIHITFIEVMELKRVDINNTKAVILLPIIAICLALIAF